MFSALGVEFDMIGICKERGLHIKDAFPKECDGGFRLIESKSRRLLPFDILHHSIIRSFGSADGLNVEFRDRSVQFPGAVVRTDDSAC